MTIKELYELAKEHNTKNKKIGISSYNKGGWHYDVL